MSACDVGFARAFMSLFVHVGTYPGLMCVAGAKQGASALDYAANVVKAARIKRQRDGSTPLKDLVNIAINEYNAFVAYNPKYQITGYRISDKEMVHGVHHSRPFVCITQRSLKQSC